MMFVKMFDISSRSRLFGVVLCAAMGVSVLSACDMTQNYLKADRAGNMETQDYRDGLASRIPLYEQQAAMRSEDRAPDFQSYVAMPPENLRPMPLVSISVNQAVPLKDILFELAKQADYDIELDPRITGSIIFTARQRPFDLVIQRISEIAGLRHSFDEDILRVELDLPYSRSYKIDYLNIVRTSTSSIRNQVSVGAAETSAGSGFEASSTSEANFWEELSTNLSQILGVGLSRGTLKTQRDPRISVAEQNPAPVAAVPVDGADGAVAVQAQAPQAVLQVSSLPLDDNGNGEELARGEASFSVNRQAGMISVYATERQHKEVQEYLRDLKRASTSQVLIEAKLLEVELTDEFSTGIEWRRLALGGSSGFDLLAPFRGVESSSGAPDGAILRVRSEQDTIRALSQFGHVRALASPRLTVLNNQSAVLNVAENEVYFELDFQTTELEGGRERVEVSSEVKNVPVGVLINVQPSINLEDRTVSMSLRPTITSISDRREDPGVSIFAQQVGADVQSSIPVIQVQEFDSMISVSSGEAVLMGGLMRDSVRSERRGIPVLGEMPLLGGAFRSQRDTIQKTEVIVFLRATIIEGSNIHQTDRELYRMFSGDRRPLDL